MKTSDLVRRIDELIAHGNEVLKTRKSTDQYSEWVNSDGMAGFRAASLSFIKKLYDLKHPYFGEFDNNTNSSLANAAEKGIAILKAIRSEISGGWMFTFKGLVAAELFADFLDMANHLLETGYKDSAAVMIGGVLEEHLRQLCLKHDLAVDDVKEDRVVAKKSDRLNADLAKAEVYSKLDQKQITAWLDLRNNAAHGKYGEYTDQQVKQLLSGVIEFMTRVAV
ncbi:MAG: hypothetical protein NTY60_01205 [Proteobacteria bacterium]|nr:hypothetical protein [Pseudomonadota bacterium]